MLKKHMHHYVRSVKFKKHTYQYVCNVRLRKHTVRRNIHVNNIQCDVQETQFKKLIETQFSLDSTSLTCLRFCCVQADGL